ncbi:MAG: ABC transporter permease [Alphaproteobacteria bacterium]|nr:ABC transporter permease [Alphaproteobacteria bacterium]
MSAFVLRRLMQAVLVILVVTLIVFFGVSVIGNPIDILVGPDCNQACQAEAIAALGLDRPLVDQYLLFLANLAQGKFGTSYVLGSPTIDLILQRMPATLELAFSAMTISVAIGIPLGMWAGLQPEAPSGKAIMVASILGFSLPTFWIGTMLIVVFSVELGWLPPTGRGPTVDLFGIPVSFLTLEGLTHLALPAINLALFNMSLVIRLTQSGVREVLLTDYVKFARAKGLTNRRVILVHVLKNVLIPVVTVTGLELGNVIAFAVVTETIFAWPGMGKLIIDSIQVLDRPVIVAYLMIIVTMFVIINLIVDIAYSVLDPRIRLQRSAT